MVLLAERAMQTRLSGRASIPVFDPRLLMSHVARARLLAHALLCQPPVVCCASRRSISTSGRKVH